MASKEKQLADQERQQAHAIKLFSRSVGAWFASVTADFNIGQTQPTQEQRTELRVILRRGYENIGRKILGTDWRLYRQIDPFDVALAAMAIELDRIYRERSTEAEQEISQTVAAMMVIAISQALADAVEAGVAPTARVINRTAQRNLGQRLGRHKLTIAVTEGNWAVQTTRNTAILQVTDPLGNTIEEIARLIEDGDIRAAQRLSRRVEKMSRLPNSIRQGRLIRFVGDQRDRLVTPFNQANAVTQMRAMADELGAEEKIWVTRGDDKVRESHQIANGQRRAPDRPFDLAGGQMQWPMDGSLGASLGEIINCRCKTVWE